MKHFLPFIFMLAFSLASVSQPIRMNARISTGSDENMYSIRPNAVYTDDLALYNYERLLPLGEKIALELKGGFLIQDPLMLLMEAGFAVGGPRHFIEGGVGSLFNTGSHIQLNFYDQNFISTLDKDAYFTLRGGYRYQSPEGMLLKLSLMYSPGNFTVPLIGLGYTF